MKTEIKKEITEILDNIIYWDGCPDSYKKRIPELIKELETTKPVNVGLADIRKCQHPFEFVTGDDHIAPFFCNKCNTKLDAC
jgi:hypothetical protein